jgi:hypothetical protein
MQLLFETARRSEEFPRSSTSRLSKGPVTSLSRNKNAVCSPSSVGQDKKVMTVRFAMQYDAD